jgi:hypothetical protein
LQREALKQCNTNIMVINETNTLEVYELLFRHIYVAHCSLPKHIGTSKKPTAISIANCYKQIFSNVPNLNNEESSRQTPTSVLRYQLDRITVCPKWCCYLVESFLSKITN